MINTSPAKEGKPSMLSQKNLTILEDQLNYESLCTKKFELYANDCQDANLKNICEKAAQMHKKHFEMLFNYLNDRNKPQQ